MEITRGVFPKNEEAAIRRRLASAIKFVASQRLVPKKGGGRIAVVEVLRTSERARDYIINGEKGGKSLHDVMKDGYTTLGTQTFDMVLKDYIEKGIITMETGLLYATNANDLKVSLGSAAQQEGSGTSDSGDLDLELQIKF